MVLDGEENEALRVLGEERLIGLLRLEGRGDLLGLGGLLVRVVFGIDLGLELSKVLVEGLVLLVGGTELELLGGRVHVEVLDTGGNLCSARVSYSHGGGYVS